MLLEYLIDQNNIDIDRSDVRMISDLILGEYPKEDNEKSKPHIYFNLLFEGWMFDIVANKRNGLDVDKFDYLHRDQVSLGIQCGSFNNKRIIKNSRVIDN
jgi:HD superfamily phosphohydrolase